MNNTDIDIIPKYQKLIEIIKNKINTGELKESDRLITESEICQKYHVSRITVKKATDILVNEGVLIKKQGLGTFVASSKVNRIFKNKPLSFTEMCEAQGMVSSSLILSIGQIYASAKIAKELHVAENDEVIKIVRVRKSDGLPVLIEEMYMPINYGYVTEGDLTKSILAIVNAHGTKIVHAISRIEICYANELEHTYLNVPLKKPMLLQHGTGTDERQNIVYYSKQVINSDRYQLMIVI